jgi:hypothetical protein
MAVVGTGSLCAGRYALPVGVNRQYNVIELSPAFDGARVHVREMVAGKVFGRATRPEFGGRSYVDLSWQAPAFESSLASSDEDALLVDAERALREGRAEDAMKALTNVIRPPGSFARKLMQEALRVGGRWDELVVELGTPATPGELVDVVTALGEAGRVDEAKSLLDAEGMILGLNHATKDDLVTWLSAKQVLHGQQ